MRRGDPVHLPVFLAGGGDLGSRIAAHDWSATPLGPLQTWPESLRTAVSVCLSSRFPIVIYWGAELTVLYNDAYAEILGSKHPWALGQPCRVCWAEIWDTIGPMLTGVMSTGEATWSDNLLLMLERHGYAEECYFSFSFGPVRVDDGSVGGVFTAVVETTRRVIGERRLALLRDIAARTVEARSAEEACSLAAEAMTAHPSLPFVLLYLLSPGGDEARLVAASGVAPGSAVAPASVALDGACLWPLDEVARDRVVLEVDIPPAMVEDWAGPVSPPRQALVLPLVHGAQAAGVLVAAVNPHRSLDDAYRSFFALVAGQVGTALGDARAYEAERRRAEALAELDRAKTAFFSNVSHEFRTPLTLLLGPLEDVLDRGLLDDPDRERVTLAHRNALRLLRLVDTLLDVARLEGGRMTIVPQSVDLAQLTRDLAGVFGSAAHRAGLDLVVDCPPLPGPVAVDPEIWERIVFNLLSNALKFTLAGTIEVRLRGGDGVVVLSVRDTGIGVPADELPHLFDRFHRVREARGRTLEGAGIGLALVHELVLLQGGRVDVTSVVGEGSTFAVTLPVATAGGPPSASADVVVDAGRNPYVQEALRWLPAGEGEGLTAEPPPGVVPRGRVVVADDNADLREHVTRLLAVDWTVEAVPNGAAALAACRRQPPDLLVSDVMMPDLDGFELLRTLRAGAATADIPVILLSARAGEEAWVEGLDAGADDYVVKPFNARELQARVRSVVRLARLRREVAASRRDVELRREEAEKTLAHARRMRELEQLKGDFLNVAAHELRGPITVARGYLSMVLDGSLDVHATREVLPVADSMLERINQLVDQMLATARLETEPSAAERELVDLRELATAAADDARVHLGLGHRLVLEVGDEPLPAVVDPDAVRTVLSNLLTNAIKYSPAGGDVRVVAAVDHPRRTVTVSVSDHGLGIGENDLPRLFQRFGRVVTPENSSIPGGGLGLFISRQLARRNGGDIGVDSRAGKGSTFTLSLPLADAADVPPGTDP